MARTEACSGRCERPWGGGKRSKETGNGSKHQQLITGIRIATQYGPLAWAYFELNATVKKQMWKKKTNLCFSLFVQKQNIKVFPTGANGKESSC